MNCWRLKSSQRFNSNLQEKGINNMSTLKGKKMVILGDRDGIPAPAIAACVETAGAEVVFAVTECFV
jgi:betaine reductase